MIIVYSGLYLNQLYSSTPFRTEEWYKENLHYDELRNKIANSIFKEGLKHPLCCFNEKDNNTFRIDVGNQRFAALKKLKYNKPIPCLILCFKNQSNIPEGEIISRTDIEKRFFNNKTKRLDITEQGIYIMSQENDLWDPEVIYTIGKVPRRINRSFNLRF